MRLAGKVAIVTGSGSGIGRDIACLFAKEGAKVVVTTDNNIKGAEMTVEMIKKDGGYAQFIKADVSKSDDVKYLIRESHDKFGKIDILVNNAGMFMKDILIEDMDEELWDRIYSVNVKGTFLAIKYVVPYMKKAGNGVIINIGSGVVNRPLPKHAPYVSSKGAVNTLTKALAKELAPAIRVNCINPGLTETPMTMVMPEAVRKQIGDSFPMGRLTKPEEIANAALFLACNESIMITGSIINVDGGDAI